MSLPSIKWFLIRFLSFCSAAQVTAVSAHGGTWSLPVTRAPQPRDINPRAASQQTASGFVDNSWYIPVSIGTPPQSFMFLTDSGAPGFSVASVLLPEDEQPSGPKYDPSKSNTAHQQSGYTYALAFVSGDSSSGVVYQDVITIANLTVPDMNIEVQTHNNHNNSNSSSPRTGNLGLNFDQNGQTTKPQKLPTWLQKIMPTLKSAVFTVDFDSATSNGTFDFGYIDASKYSGSINYANVNQSFGGGWTIPISGQELSNGTFLPSDDWWVTIDTGTSDATISRNVADAYFSQVSGSRFDTGRGAYTFACTTKLPDFTFGVGSGQVSIAGAHLVSNSGSFNSGKTCTSKLNVGTGDGPYLWGQSFVQEFFVVFDWSQGRVGFASKASSSTTSAPSATSSLQTTTAASNQTSATGSTSAGTSHMSRIFLGLTYGVVASLLTIILQV